MLAVLVKARVNPCKSGPIWVSESMNVHEMHSELKGGERQKKGAINKKQEEEC